MKRSGNRMGQVFKKVLHGFMLYVLCNLFTYHVSSAQSVNHDAIIREFMHTTDDSLFIASYSSLPYQKFTVTLDDIKAGIDFSDSLAFFHHDLGDISGPYKIDSFDVYLKVIKVDSITKMRTGNIYLYPGKRGKEATKELAAKILQEIEQTGDYDKTCKTYSEDNNKANNCDLGWFYQGMMVKEFEEAVMTHRKGDCFIVYTRYGAHIVKVLEDPVKEKNRTEYVFLHLRNK